MLRTLRLPALLLAAVTACSSTDSPIRDAQVIETTTFAPALGVNLGASTKLASGMYIRDITVGTGADVVAGQNVSMRYTGTFNNGTQFDANTSGTPFSFRLGAGLGTWRWEVPTGEMTCSDRLITMIGYTREAFPTQADAWAALVHPDDLPGWLAATKEHFQRSQSALRAELRVRRRRSRPWVCCGSSRR